MEAVGVGSVLKGLLLKHDCTNWPGELSWQASFNPDGDLFVTSRAEGNVYRIESSGESTVYVEGMGVATGAAFDADGNLFVGDRSGTIFKINPQRQIFVHATLEPSGSA